MRTLNVSISDIEYDKFGLKDENLSFTDFIDLVSKEITRQNLNKCLELADKYGLSKMSMEEITNEVKAVRQNAKNRN
jgi:predicted CopG family antitoxin